MLYAKKRANEGQIDQPFFKKKESKWGPNSQIRWDGRLRRTWGSGRLRGTGERGGVHPQVQTQQAPCTSTTIVIMSTSMLSTSRVLQTGMCIFLEIWSWRWRKGKEKRRKRTYFIHVPLVPSCCKGRSPLIATPSSSCLIWWSALRFTLSWWGPAGTCWRITHFRLLGHEIFSPSFRVLGGATLPVRRGSWEERHCLCAVDDSLWGDYGFFACLFPKRWFFFVFGFGYWI